VGRAVLAAFNGGIQGISRCWKRTGGGLWGAVLEKGGVGSWVGRCRRRLTDFLDGGVSLVGGGNIVADLITR